MSAPPVTPVGTARSVFLGSGGGTWRWTSGTGSSFIIYDTGGSITGPGGLTQDFNISYTADSTGNAFSGGNDIALQAVPEPSTWAMMLGGLGMLGFYQRSRRSRKA